jgi:DNA replication protein DnaC
MLQQTIDKLSSLKLSGFLAALREQKDSSQYERLSFDERLAFLVDKEFARREERRVSKALKDAQLKQSGTIEDVDFDSLRGLNRAQILELSQCGWIQKNHNLIITGPTGAGKSFLACAMANQACRHQIRALYIKSSDLVLELLLAKADGSSHKLADRLNRFKLLVIDEWLRDSLSQEQAREVLDLLDDRYRACSTVFVSQLPVPDWHKNIQDPTLADAILDRIVHDSHRVVIKNTGESMRKRTAQLT